MTTKPFDPANLKPDQKTLWQQAYAAGRQAGFLEGIEILIGTLKGAGVDEADLAYLRHLIDERMLLMGFSHHDGNPIDQRFSSS
jgi:hypothetical protein